MTALNTFGLRVPSIYVKERQTLSLALSVKNVDMSGATSRVIIAGITEMSDLRDYERAKEKVRRFEGRANETVGI